MLIAKLHLKLLLVFFAGLSLMNAQCPTVTMVNNLTLTSCTSLGQTLTATSNYSANISSKWIAPGGIPLASVGSATSTALINHAGTYTVEFKDNVSNCVVNDTVAVVTASNINKPTFSLMASSYTPCANAPYTINIINGNTSSPPGGPVSYTMLVPAFSGTSIIGGSFSLTTNAVYSLTTCGNIFPITKDNVSQCISSFDVAITCTPFNGNLSIAGPSTVCLGASASFTASGATNYVWNTGANTPTMQFSAFTQSPLASASTLIGVTGIDLNGCSATASTALTQNNNCSNVWPGDANRDGIVNNLDVLELGLWANTSGPARSFTSNVYSSQFSANWTGTVSTGWNRVNADCNGDGLVNANDTLAIANNYTLTHAFRVAKESNSADVRIVAPPVLSAGNWNKLDLVLGSGTFAVNQLYGIAFQLDFDSFVLQQDSVYIVYTPSFLSAQGQNIHFQKHYFSAGTIYAATVRTNGNDVSGYGKIAEIFIKPKMGLTTGTLFSMQISGVKKVNSNGILENLNDDVATMQLDNNALAINQSVNEILNLTFCPNPVENKMTLLANNELPVNYSLYDISGRMILKGNFLKQTEVDCSLLDNGYYILKLDDNSQLKTVKVLIRH